MAMCEICGKKRQMGNRVSHANNRTKHEFKPNIQKIRVKEDNGNVCRKYVCTRCIKSGNIVKA
jgi:large subunit ribosomal protein L28